MATIGLVLRPGVDGVRTLACEISDWAKKNNHTLLVEQGSADVLECTCQTVSADELASQADPIVTLGGDGTLIGLGRHVTSPSPLMVGVNFGTLGFLTEVSPQEVFDVLQTAIDGSASVGERIMLRATVSRNGKEVFSCQAVNDAVIQKGSRDALLDLDLHVQGEDVTRLRADGVILATPTGSTAYSLAAGGSIVHPSLDVVLVTPICAHALTSRPFILPLSFEIDVHIPEYGGEVFLSVDGQESCELTPGDVVSVRRSEHSVRFVLSKSKSYFNILRRKLNWGVANQGD